MLSKNKFKAPLYIIISLLIVLALSVISPKIVKRIEIEKALARNEAVLEKFEPSPPETEPQKAAEKQKLLKVPFICQAPLRTEENWKLHEESCEEAALLQTFLYETNSEISREDANEKILDMIDWQIIFFGNHKDLYDDDMKKFAENYLILSPDQFVVIKNATLADIKAQIDQNHPVIVPVTSQFLENPYYPYPGYHMLTVIGYTKDKIITNDNGTCRGEGFVYENEKFEKAMKDAVGSIYILNLNQ